VLASVVLDEVTVKLTPTLVEATDKKPGFVRAPVYVSRIVDEAVTCVLATVTVDGLPGTSVAVPVTGRDEAS